jgi:hypothetical protein
MANPGPFEQALEAGQFSGYFGVCTTVVIMRDAINLAICDPSLLAYHL